MRWPTTEDRRRLAASAAVLLAVLGLTEILLFAASFTRAPLTVDVGPSTGAYMIGFTDSEERPPLTFRWARVLAAVEPPLASSGGDGTLVIRFARFLDQPTTTHVFVSGAASGSFPVRPGRFRVGRLPLAATGGPVRLELRTDDTDGSGLGLAIDWIRIEGPRWTLPRSLLAPRLLVAGLFLIALASGFHAAGAGLAALALGLAEAAWAAVDPFALAHVSSRVAWPALAITAICAALFRGRGRVVVLIVLAGYLLKAAGVFHPSYFYPDVRNHARYVAAFARAPGGIVERGISAQVQVRTAYPRIVAGKAYAFPYSPLFFVPFSWLPPGRATVEDALKHVALLAAAAQVAVVFWLSRLVLGPGSGLFAALFAAFLPPLYSRLLLATYPNVLGHLLDVVAIALAARLAARPASAGRVVALGASTLLAMLTYISSLFNLSGFLVCLAALERSLSRRLLLAWALAATLTVALLYLPFTIVFLGEIVPALWTGGGVAATASRPADGLLHELRRIPLFFGYAYPALAIWGLAVSRRRAEPSAYRVLLAFGLTVLLLVALRGLGGGLFKDLREVEFAAPLVAVAAGAALEWLAARGRTGRAASAILAGSLVGFGLLRYRGYLAATISPIDLG